MKYKYEVRQIDAWNDGESWTWNESFHIGEYAVSETANEKRAFLRALHKLGITAKRGYCRVDYDGSIYELSERKTGMPLFAAVPMF